MRTKQNRLTTRQILAWADAHYKRTGRWPTRRTGNLQEAPQWGWAVIDGCLEFGGSGLPGGTSLNFLLAQHRGYRSRKERGLFSTKLILVWADRHRIRTGDWPFATSGPVQGVPGETWRKIDNALRHGLRGLERGSSLAKLLSRRRNKPRGRERSPDISVDQILKWADAHKKRTGSFPNTQSGRVHGAEGQLWRSIDGALRRGLRGLPGGDSLPQLLARRRGKRNRLDAPRLRIKQILQWADRHNTRTRKWPNNKSGPVTGAAGEKWQSIDSALRGGLRGLEGGSSLHKLLTKRRGKIDCSVGVRKTPLSTNQILKWADAYHKRNGKWPVITSGRIPDANGETWHIVQSALSKGIRGLNGISSLAMLLARAGRKQHRFHRPRLAIKQILAWADAHKKRTGDWPKQKSGVLKDSPEDRWECIDAALYHGRRGLTPGGTLAGLLEKYRGRINQRTQPRLSVKQILQWADAHKERTGSYPERRDGPIHGLKSETWLCVDRALTSGHRGLPGGDSLPRLLHRQRGKQNHLTATQLTHKQILKWADAHHKRTGRWPTEGAARVHGTDRESWMRIANSLRNGIRGLPGGDSLAQLLSRRRGSRNISDLPKLTMSIILKWADTHKKHTGRWPTVASGAVIGEKGEDWANINASLTVGNRGLAPGNTLARVLARYRGRRNHLALQRLTVKQVLRWADAYHQRFGIWPCEKTGPISGVPGETWCSVDNALRGATRGLPKATSLSRLLNHKRGVVRRRTEHPLSVREILSWADAHKKRTGGCPWSESGEIPERPGTSWQQVNHALRVGRLGLPGGTTLSRLLYKHRRRSRARNRQL
ncbi:MAG: hypothetical protein V3W34_06035 [Phycisphaerae bacterium]